MDDQELLHMIRDRFLLEWNGIHGLPHWTRVIENGLRLAPSTGANPKIVELFAFLHDAQRRSNGRDPEHGARAARFVQSLGAPELDLEPAEFDLLVTACRDHSHGLTVGDVTILTCWDADRLDLGRVGIRPRPESLCTEAARAPDVLEWAYRRSLTGTEGAE